MQPLFLSEDVIIPTFNIGEFLTSSHSLFGIAVFNWITGIAIFLFLSYIYNNVFRVRRLPVLKAVIVYVMIAIGSFMLLIFEVDAGLPIVYSLAVVVGMMLLLRIRTWLGSMRRNKS